MSGPRAPLRVGLLLDEPKLPWWIAPALTAARERGIATIALAVIRRPPLERDPAPRPVRWWRNRKVLGYALTERLDRWRQRQLTPADLGLEVMGNPRTLEVEPSVTRFSDSLSDADVEQLRRSELDLLIRLGFRILRGPVLAAARHGTWSFHHGDNRRYRGGPPAVWEVLEDREESGITLQRLTEELDGGVVLARTICATERFSFARNRHNLLRHSAPMLLASLERLQRGADPVQPSAAEDPSWQGYGARVYRMPTNRELAHLLPRLGLRYLAHRLRSAGRKLQWSLAWHWADGTEPETPHGVLYRYHEIRPPKDRFWADPFVVRDAGRWWMFFEELRDRDPRGEIGVWEMGQGGPLGEPRIVLRRPYHLSYPQVFRHEGLWYMLPETALERRIELYVAERFPEGWRLHSTLLEGIEAVDATLLSHGGHWYLFASKQDELHAFTASRPFGPFIPHPANPLVSDIRSARMAGRFFHSGGRLYRPAQRGTPFYGAGLSVSEVLELSPSCYRERVVHRLEPGWDRGLLGVHTLNAADGLSVIDLLRLVRR
jgi:hypothetical protein